MEDFEPYTRVRKNVDGDGFDLLTKQCINTLTGSRSPSTRHGFEPRISKRRAKS